MRRHVSLKQRSIVFNLEMACAGVQVVKAFKNKIFSPSLTAFSRNPQFSNPLFIKYRAFSTIPTENENDRDPAPLFFNTEVQGLLKTLTRVDLKKVYRKRKDGAKLEPPVYKFMTDEDLEAALNEAKAKSESRLQMPPVVKKKTITPRIIASDPALQGYDNSKLVFTDITYGVKNTDRIIVVRDTDGVLRNADYKERQRLNQIYFPLEGREIDTPKLFQKEYLMDLLNREEYEFILDLACVQFEPNDPEYHAITETVYSHVNSINHFDHLRSTRHFGPLAFHLAWNKEIDKLLLENIQTGRLDEAVLLVQLYHKINPTASSAEAKFDGDELKFVQSYIDNDSNMKCTLELAVQSYIDIENAKREVSDGIKRAHGLE